MLSPYLSDNCKAYAELIIEPTTSPWFPTDLAIGTIILLEDGVKSSRWITFHHDDEIIDERLNINQVLSSLPTCSIAHFVESMQTRYHLIIVQVHQILTFCCIDLILPHYCRAMSHASLSHPHNPFSLRN